MLCLTNALAAFYLGVIHQRGVIDVMLYLRREAKKPGTVTGVTFLMPCHSTPLNSHFHHNVPMRFITCEPPIGVEDKAAYLDETDIFYKDPLDFIKNYFEDTPSLANNGTISAYEGVLKEVPRQGYKIRSYTWTSHVIIFASLEKKLSRVLAERKYTKLL
ncbi:glycosylphosphatidylinositol anchor biosynthesis [Chytridiales sp. JEL 0842]|nr:glycosylphosphatidylinositol anchor biosynthesis [Chytridiales sp. JEL 0842]